MVVICRNDAQQRKNIMNKKMVKTAGQRKSKLKFPFAAILNNELMITPRIGWASNPTARSEKARLRNNDFTLAGIA